MRIQKLTDANREAILVGVAIAAGGAALTGLVNWCIDEAKKLTAEGAKLVAKTVGLAAGVGFMAYLFRDRA